MNIQSMHDYRGWRQITCTESEKFALSVLSVGSTLTDLSGQFGDPIVFTEWHDEHGPVLRNIRHPAPLNFDGSSSGPDVRPCEHYVPTLELASILADDEG